MMKNKVVTFTFLIFLISFSILNVLTPPTEISFSERRTLQLFSELEIEELLTGDFLEDFDKAALDQFFMRDQFRRLKALVDGNLFHKTDNNDIIVQDDNAFKLEYPLNTKSIERFADLLNTIVDLYAADNPVYFALIPDKNYYVESNPDFLKLDYAEMERILAEQLTEITLIDIKDALSLDDYYRTDPHWKQENLDGVVAFLKDAMGMETDFEQIQYKIERYAPFYGAYYGQSALNLAADTIEYRISEVMKNAVVDNFEYTGDPDQAPGVYDEEKLGSIDSYDVFLSGSTPLITVENPNSTTDKELIIFRDSFASSLTPLLIEEYKKITLIDLRYVSHEMIGEFVNFEESEILFLYSTLVINHSEILK